MKHFSNDLVKLLWIFYRSIATFLAEVFFYSMFYVMIKHIEKAEMGDEKWVGL